MPDNPPRSYGLGTMYAWNGGRRRLSGLHKALLGGPAASIMPTSTPLGVNTEELAPPEMPRAAFMQALIDNMRLNGGTQTFPDSEQQALQTRNVAVDHAAGAARHPDHAAAVRASAPKWDWDVIRKTFMGGEGV